MSSQLLEAPAADADQSTAVIPPQTPAEPDVLAEAFDFITRHVLEKDSILFGG